MSLLAVGLVAVMALVGEGLSPRPARAGTTALPSGWTARTVEGREILEWTSREPLGRGGARVEILAGSRSLGPAEIVSGGHLARVVLPVGLPPAVAASAGLQVLAAGRRLDASPFPGAQAGGASAQESPLLTELRSLPLLDEDPGRRGAHETLSGEYSLPELRIPGLSTPSEVRGLVVGPKDTTGSRPLVLFLHGRHPSCYRVGATEEEDEANRDTWPCPDGWNEIPSYRGYRQIQEVLASRGYVTVSVSANGIGAQDMAVIDGGTAARAFLLRHHLDEWTRWASGAGERSTAPEIVRGVAPVDPGRVLLVGHSRGGEGVNRAALDSSTTESVDWRVRGVVHIAPTSFGKNPAPGVPTVVILPSCDGDIFDLQGQEYVDAARDIVPAPGDPALRSSVLLLGANHNYFNSHWSSGESQAPSWDDWMTPTDPLCGTGEGNIRLTAAEQRQVAATYVGAAVAVFVEEDEDFLPLLDGSGARVASLGGAGVSVHALGGRREAVLVPQEDTRVSAVGPASAAVCRTFDTQEAARACRPVDGPPGPHFVPFSWLPEDPARASVRVEWSEAGGSTAVALSSPVSLVGHAALELRVLSRAGLDGTTGFGVGLTDGAGRRVALGDVVLRGMGEDRSPASLHARSVRLGLDTEQVRAAGIDLGAVTGIEVVPRSARGRIWLLDAWGWSPGLSARTAPQVPRLDVGTVDVREGAEDHTVDLPVNVTGRVVAVGQAWAGLFDPFQGNDRPGQLIRVAPDVRRLVTEVPVVADSTRGESTVHYNVWLKALAGVCVGDYVGRVTVEEDD